MLFNIITVFALMFWLAMYMGSFIALGAPSSENDSKEISIYLVFLFFPCAIFLIYALFQIEFFGVEPLRCLLVSFVAITILTLPHSRSLLNLARGIKNTGYSIRKNKVYYDAKRIRADAKTFKVLPEQEDLAHFRYRSDYGKDAVKVFYRGKPIEYADPSSFEPVNVRYSEWRDKRSTFTGGARTGEIDSPYVKRL